MKKLIVSLITLAISASSFAQVQIGPTVGFNVSMFRYSQSVDKNTYLPGYSVGLKMNINLTEALAFQPAIIWNSVGGKAGETDFYTSTSLNYLAVPLNLVYGFGDKATSQFQIFAGPYMGYGVSGTAKAKIPVLGENSTDVKFGSENTKVNPVDYGLNFGIGYKLNPFLFNVGYMLGLSNLNNGDGTKVYNSGFNFSATLLFGGK